MGTIKIVTPNEDSNIAVDNNDVGTKGIFSNTGKSNLIANVVSDVSSDEIQKNLNDLVSELGAVLNKVDQKDGYNLKQFSVGVEISASGGVSLIGKLNAGAKAAVTLVFERG